MQKVLISACLLGSPVRYDGSDLEQHHAILQRWQREQRVVSCCPEVAGGLATPRTPAEIQGHDGKEVLAGKATVVTETNEDVTQAFTAGAQKALELCQSEHIKVAILTEKSPSCGSSIIYDGRFKRHKVAGQGVTAALLTQQGIRVFNQHQLVEADAFLATLENR